VALEKSPSYRFGPFRLDPLTRRLTRDGEAVALTARAFDTLVVLVENHGRVVTKDELIDSVWHAAFVEENNLNQAISALRRALHDDGNGNHFIGTVPRRGYTLVVPVLEGVEADPTPPATSAPARAPAAAPAVSTPARRPRSNGRWLATILVASCALAVGTFWLVRPSAPPSALARVRSIAVLPFRPLVLPPDDEFLGLALADAVITRLSGSSSLAVRPTGAIRDMGARTPEPVSAGKALGVDAVLDGQIQESGDRVRVTLQLVGVASGTPLWSERFDAPRANLFELEDSIAEGVARELAAGRSDGSLAAARRAPVPQAYEAYLRGRYYWNKRTQDALRKSQTLFQQALDADPTFAPAWAGLADARNLVGQALAARAAAGKALDLDPGLAEAHAALGNVALFYDFDIAAAQAHFQRAIGLNPSYATAYQWSAFGLAAAGSFDEALARIRKARELDPLSLSIATDVATILYYSGRYEEAERQARAVIEMDPNFAQAHNVLGLVLLVRNVPGATGEFEAAGSPPVALAIAFALTGRKEEARAIAEQLARMDRDRFDLLRAALLLALGERKQALDELDQAYRDRQGDLLMVGVEPLFAALHGDPRFEGLLRRLRLSA
jgi:DNA-binding winged helix-turn-helix (wHTH) protein/TolB-like protein